MTDEKELLISEIKALYRELRDRGVKVSEFVLRDLSAEQLADELADSADQLKRRKKFLGEKE